MALDPGPVTNRKLANMKTARLKGRVTAGTGDPEDLTGTEATTLLDAFTAALKGVAPASGGGTANYLRADGSWAVPGGTYSDEAAQDAVGAMVGASLVYVDAAPLLARAALTGDVTAAQDSNATVIANDAVSLAKMADMATASLIYRKTAGTGDPEVNTLATLKTDLGLTGTNSGDQTSIVGITGSLAEFNTALTGADFASGGGTATGANTGDQTITLTGMVTGSGTGSFAASLGSFTKAELSAAVSDGDPLYVGDLTQYTDEQAQDAIGAMVDASLTYVDAAPLLQRAALTGDASAAAGSNALTLATVNGNVGSFGLAAAVSQFTVNAKGLITAAANVAIAIASTAITDATAAGRAMLQAATAAAQTALLDVRTVALKGLAPVGGHGVTTVDFGAFPGASDASVAITGQTGIAAGSAVFARIQATATADHSADEHVVETIDIQAGNISAGTGFTIYAKNTGPGDTRLYGQWTVAYQWAA